MKLNKFQLGKSCIVLALSLTSVIGWSQQQWQYSQYMNNNFLINPAEGGTEKFTDIKLGLRTQWVGLEGAPKSGFLSVSHAFNKHGDDFEDVIPLAHHGVGGYISRDQTGPITQSSIYGSYSYHLPLSSDLTLSLGAFLGIKQYQLDKSLLRFEGNESDIVTNGFGTDYLPDATLGFWLYGSKFYAGGSTFQVFGNKLNTPDFSNSPEESALARHYFLTAGCKVQLTDQFYLVPSLMLKYSAPAPVQLDVNLKLRYQDLVWFGTSYRNKDSFILLAGVTLEKKWDIGYSYDINTSGLNPYNSGSHEILLGYRLMNKEYTAPPSQFW